MDPVAEDVQGPDDISKESLKPAPDPETIVLRKNRNKDSKKEQRRWETIKHFQYKLLNFRTNQIYV